MRKSQRFKLLLAAGCLALPGTLWAVGDAADHNSLLEWRTGGDRFYLTSRQEEELVDFPQPREVRVCADDRSDDVSIRVEHDGDRSVVRPGECVQMEASTVRVTPAEALPPNVELTGTVNHR